MGSSSLGMRIEDDKPSSCLCEGLGETYTEGVLDQRLLLGSPQGVVYLLIHLHLVLTGY